MLKGLSNRLREMNPWHLLWISVICAEVLTAIVSTIFSLILWGSVSSEVLIIGMIDSFVVAGIVVGLAIFYTKQIRVAELTNEQLRQEIEQRKKIQREKEKLHKQLQQAQRIEAIGRLAGGIAHDFNNLLAAILNNIYLARMHMKKGDRAFERLETAEKALTKAGALTRQLLTFSKGGDPVKRKIALAGVIQESVGFALSGSNVRSRLQIEDNLWPVDADEGQIHQVIHNLVINADQSMPEGGMISVHAENSALDSGPGGLPIVPGRYVKIAIADTGSGISEDHLQRVFEPYFTTKEKGSGLGLAMSYSIMKNHNGYIFAESKKGSGTTFTLYLPASERHNTAYATDQKKVIAGEGKILIIDDVDMVRDSLGDMLHLMGYEVESARDGAEAIEKYKQAIESSRPFDAVMMDLTIPGGMGGKEAIKKIRELNPSVKAIISSGYSDDSVIAKFRDYGFSDVLVKPYNPEQLSVTLHTILKSSAE